METGRVEGKVQRWETLQTETYETGKQGSILTMTTKDNEEHKFQQNMQIKTFNKANEAEPVVLKEKSGLAAKYKFSDRHERAKDSNKNIPPIDLAEIDDGVDEFVQLEKIASERQYEPEIR